jgi:hypothetical protein
MDIDLFYQRCLELSGTKQTALARLDLSTHVKMRAALKLAESRDFDLFKRKLGDGIKQHVEQTEESVLLSQLKTAIALRQRLD